MPRKDSRPDNTIYVDDPNVPIYQTLTKFSPGRLLETYSAAEPYIGHVFIQRPTLPFNTTYPEGKANLARIATLPDFRIYNNNPEYNQILKTLTMDAKQQFLPYAHARAKSYPVQNTELRSIEKLGTYYGHTIHYGRFSENHRKGGNVSITFANDKHRTMLVASEIWRLYINYVTKNQILKPLSGHVKNGLLDYASSIYYFVTRRDNSEIVYWEKLYGTFPTSIPMSMFDMSSGSPMMFTEEYSIDFEYSIRSEPNDHNVLLDFATLGGTSETYELLNSSIETIDRQYASKPMIHAKRDPATKKIIPGKYCLGWTL